MDPSLHSALKESYIMVQGSDKSREKIPWWFPKFLQPHEQSGDNYIVRCSCGRAMWLLSSSKVRRHHTGHEMRPLLKGASMWEFFKMKVGWLDRRTFGEWLQDRIERLA